MGFANRAFVAAGVGFAVAAIAGCGSSGGRLLSASQSNRLNEQLNRIQDALDAQNCTTARQYMTEFQDTVDNLGGVNSTLIANLDQGASTIQTLADSACKIQTATTPKKTHTHTSTSTTTTSTHTTQTFTNPTTTVYTQPANTQTTLTQPTNTTGGTCPTCGITTTTNTNTTSSTTTSNGGTGLGGTGTGTGTGTDTTGTTTTTSTGPGG